MADRSQAFKHRGESMGDRRHARQEAGIQLRKDKREDQELKRRNLVVSDAPSVEVAQPPVVSSSHQL